MFWIAIKKAVWLVNLSPEVGCQLLGSSDVVTSEQMGQHQRGAQGISKSVMWASYHDAVSRSYIAKTMRKRALGVKGSRKFQCVERAV